VWRWYVSNALRGQQPPPLQEVRAAAIDPSHRFVQKNERYLADGAPAPKEEPAR
jgi:hypothetical protein